MPRKTPLVYGVFDAWWSDGACASLGRVCKIGNKMRSSVYLNEVEVVCWCSTTRPRHASGLGSAVLCRESMSTTYLGIIVIPCHHASMAT
jgi:hypothetical protein